jgi:hypothetical protein
VQPAQLYGSLDDGTARRLYLLPQTHPANHITRSGIGAVVDWVQTTTPAPQPRSPGDQIWYWKELGTALSLLGGLLWLPALGGVLLGGSYFGAVRAPLTPANGLRGRGWWVAAGIFALLPALTYFPLQLPGMLITPNAWLPQNITNGILTWALGSAMIALALLLGWHYASADRRRDGFAAYGLARIPASTLGRTVLLGVVIVGTAHLLVVTTAWLFTTDFRIWIIAAKPLDALRAGIGLGYVVPFVAFFVVVGAVMHGQLRDSTAPSPGRTVARNAVLMGLGIAVLLAVQYVPLFAGGVMPLSGTPWTLLTIVAIQFVVLLPITGAISTYFFHATGQVYLGGVVNGLLVTWMIVSTQAIQHAY